jgi:uncharacterized protein involved in outer membrane biogenesis
VGKKLVVHLLIASGDFLFLGVEGLEMKKLLKYLLIFLLVIITAVALLLAFSGSIARHYIEKNCLEWTGRRITIGHIGINPFNGSVSIKDIKVYEEKGDSVFFSCHEISVQVELKKALNKVYAIDKLSIDNPEIRVFQNGKKFNFDDLVKHFADSAKKPKTKDTTQIQYYVNNVSITNASIAYDNVPVHNIFRIHELNFNLPEFAWNKPDSKLHLDFNYGTGGAFSVDMELNRKTLAYNLALTIDKYDLSQYYAPLKTAVNISSLKGQLSTKLRVHGTFNKPENFSLVGGLSIKDIELCDMSKRKFFSLGEFATYCDSMNVKKNMFIFRDILIDRPYIAYDAFTNGNNFSELVKQRERPVEHEEKDTATGKSKVDYSNMYVLLESSIRNLAVDFLSANYHTDSIIIRNGELTYKDHTPHHYYHASLSKINLLTDEVGPKNKKVVFHLSADLDDTGKFDINASLGYDLKHKLFSYNISDFTIPDISPIAKYVLEKNSVKWTGRRITTGSIKVTPLLGSLQIKDIKIYEADSTNVFFGCHNVLVQVDLKQMTNNVYKIDQVKIDNPEISIVQNGNNFNFDDLTKRFSSTDTTSSHSPGIHYDITDVSINGGDITYNNVPIHNVFRITDLNFNLPELSWDNPKSSLHLDFNYGTGGFFNVDMDVNRSTLRYNLALQIDHYDLSQYYAPLNTYLDISSLKGNLDTKLRLHGRFNAPQHISGTGFIHVNDLEIKDKAQNKVFGLGELALDIDTVNVHHGIYYLNKVLLDKPFIRFDYFTNGNNISQMIKYTAPPTPVKDTSTGELKPDYSNVFTLISSSIKMMAVDFVNTNYHTDSIVVKNGQLLYSDYTLNSPFHYNISDINVWTDKISSATKSLQFNIAAILNDSGKLAMSANMSLDLKDMLLDYDISNLRLADLNPYTEYYVGTPFLDGYLKYHSTDSVVNRNLKSTNIIHIAGIRTGKKIEAKPVYDLPIRMAISLLKDEKDNIDIKLPANGNLDNPDYKIGPLVGRITKELVIKTAESPFRTLAKLFDKDPEDMKQFSFEYLQDKFAEKQLRKLDDVYKVLEKKKDLNVVLTQVTDSLEEKDELALSMAKKQYFNETNHVVNDSLLSRRKRRKDHKAENKIGLQDTLFDKYLNEKLHLNGTELITMEDKCIKLVGDTMLSRQVHEKMEARNKEVEEFLIKKKELPAKRVRIVMNRDSIKTQNISEPEFEINYTAD